MPPRPEFTFARFLETATSRPALHAARAVAADVGRRARSLVLVGPTGCGKTHLLQGVAAAARAEHPEVTVVLTTARDVRADLVDALRTGGDPLAPLTPSSRALVVVDDLDSLAGNPATQELIARRWAVTLCAGISVVGAGSGPIEALGPLRGVLAPLGTRWVEMPRPTVADAERVLASLLRAHQLSPSADLTARALRDWNGDIRRLFGVVAYAEFAARHPDAAPPPLAARRA